MYDVLISFTDNVDGGVYYAGKDVYPRLGVEPTEERIAYLMGYTNKFLKPCISKIEEAQEEEEPKDIFKDMDIDQLKSYASENNIDLGNASSLAGILKKIKGN